MDNIELGRRYDGIIERCVAIFEAKTKDYGPTWLFFRDESFVDQLWIKARRIRTLEENGDDSLVGEGRADEYLGIVNYGIIMLMRMQNPELFPSPGEVVADTEAYYKLHLSDMKRAYLDAFAGVKALMAYTGTLLLVTHDRHLMNSLACPILYLEDGKAVIYPSYDALMGRAAPAPVAEKSSEPAKAGYGKEQRRRRAELRAKIKACEDEMEACGAREVELENEINSPEVYNDPQLLREKSDELSDLRFHQDELFAAWEAAVEEQEQYEQTAGGEE